MSLCHRGRYFLINCFTNLPTPDFQTSKFKQKTDSVFFHTDTKFKSEFFGGCAAVCKWGSLISPGR